MPAEKKRQSKIMQDDTLKKSRVMVVHGNRQNLADVVRALKPHCGEVQTFANLESLDQDALNIDLLLVDYSVLDMTGILSATDIAAFS